jgi:serine/threonine protein kinase
MGNIIATIGRYQLDTRLGEGASGVVYRAYDPVMDRVVAIKSARTDTLTPEQIREVIAEYHHEAKVAGKYAHENIVTIYDVITHEGLDHIVMEYVPGRSVHDYMKATGPLDLDEALSITYKCCSSPHPETVSGFKPADLVGELSHAVEHPGSEISANGQYQPTTELAIV